MMDGGPQEVTRILAVIRDGDERAAERLLPLIYDELRRLAGQRLAREPAGGGMQPTSLVHEAYIRLVGDSDPGWGSRAHFFGAAAEAMRRIVVERARKDGRLKHGGGRRRIPLDDGVAIDEPPAPEMLALDEALTRLEAFDPRMSSIVKLRYFAGMSIDETAAAMNLSARTVDREWTSAKAWLHNEVFGEPGAPQPREG